MTEQHHECDLKIQNLLHMLESANAEVAAQQAEIAALKALIAEAVRLIPLYRKWFNPQEYREGMDGLYARLAAVGNAQEQEAKWNPTTKATGDQVE